jgi:hypothetical protein
MSRTDNTKDLQHCKDAFKNIIEQCISNGDYWGGRWSLGGETYSISNVFLNNPLAPMDNGGPQTIPTQGSTIGPITPAPQTSTVDPGKFTTTLKSVKGLTVNSATTTCQDEDATVLPIWFVGAGVGIIAIPAAGADVGGIVLPPTGYLTLTNSEDGRASITQDKDQKTTKTSTSQSSSVSTSSVYSQCRGCDMETVETASISVDEDTLADISDVLPLIIPGGKTPTGKVGSQTLTQNPASSVAPLQSASPIDSPAYSP